MGNVALVAGKIAPVFTDPGHCEIYDVEIGEAVTAGQVLCWDTDGQMILADGDDNALDEPQAVALQAGSAGQVISVLHRGCVYGFTVAGINTGVLVTLTDTAGVIETAGAGECCGRVWCLAGGETTDRVILFDFNGCLAGIGAI